MSAVLGIHAYGVSELRLENQAESYHVIAGGALTVDNICHHGVAKPSTDIYTGAPHIRGI